MKSFFSLLKSLCHYSFPWRAALQCQCELGHYFCSLVRNVLELRLCAVGLYSLCFHTNSRGNCDMYTLESCPHWAAKLLHHSSAVFIYSNVLLGQLSPQCPGPCICKLPHSSTKMGQIKIKLYRRNNHAGMFIWPKGIIWRWKSGGLRAPQFYVAKSESLGIFVKFCYIKLGGP